jgi:hypothetical protein
VSTDTVHVYVEQEGDTALVRAANSDVMHALIGAGAVLNLGYKVIPLLLGLCHV